MNDEIKFPKLTLGIFIILVLVTSGVAQNNQSTARQKLLQTIRQVKKESSDMSAALIFPLIEYIETGKGAFVSEELVPDYASFLKDKNIHVRRLGVVGLNAIKSPKAIEVLFEYVKNKDYANWEERLQKSKSNMNQSYQESMLLQFEFDIFRTAVNALGESEDSRFVTFLIELFKSTNPELVEIMGPVGQALGKSGAIKELFDMIPEADNELLIYINHALKLVKDPNKVPELKYAVKDPNENIMTRCLAVSTLSGIKATGVSEFIIDIVNDKNYPITLRQTAVGAASQIKEPAVEKTLLAYAQDTNSPLRHFAFVGLLRSMPDKYIDHFFETIMDPNEELNFKRLLISDFNQSIQQDQLKKYRKQLYNCLNASDQYGRPIDRIRVFAWCQINKVYEQEPSIVLNDKNSAHPIRYEILKRIEKENRNLKHQERLKKANEEVQRIVSVYDNE